MTAPRWSRRGTQGGQHGPGGREQNENTAISARHGLPRGAGADLKEQLALALANRGGNHEFERALVTIGNLQDKLRSTTTSLRECQHHRQLAEQENHRLRKRLRDLGEHIHQPQ